MNIGRILDGQKIMEQRKNRNWNQLKLSEMSNIDSSVISRMEKMSNGVQKDFKLSAVYAIAKALDTTIDSLLVDGAEIRFGEFVPELEDALRQLSQQSEHSQKQIASIIRAYIATVDE